MDRTASKNTGKTLTEKAPIEKVAGNGSSKEVTAPVTNVGDVKVLLKAINFSLEEGTEASWIKSYPNHGNYKIRVHIDAETIDYGKQIIVAGKSTSNFKAAENFVVLECVNRLLEKGYKPKNIHLEKTWATGHGTSGRLDILVTRDDGTAYLMIECKTFGAQFDKAYKRTKDDGGQLFTYFQQDKNSDILMLYASHVEKGKVSYRNEIVKIEEPYRQTGNVKDFYDRWNKLPKNNGVFDSWVKAYDFQSKALTPKNLKDIRQEDSSFIFNQFLEILRHHVVSDKPNAFNKIFTLFLCKIYDEKVTRPNDELAFQWFYTPYEYDGMTYPPDNNISFQKRLTDLYRKGMKEFLDKSVTDISDAEFEKKYSKLDSATKKQISDEFTEIRLKKNNEFAVKEVFNDDSFEENAKVVKELVELLQGFKIRYTKKQQYLSDFFELLLTTGLKQESGQFFTPVPIAQFIIKSIPLDKIVEGKLKKGEKDNLLPTIIDYAAGSGHFITESMHEVQRIIDNLDPEDYIDSTAKKVTTWKTDHFDWAYQYVYGIEKDYRLVKVGKVGCYLHGDGLAQIVHSDGLGNFSKTEEYKGLLKKTDKVFRKENKQFDIVVSNPPYSVHAFKNNARKFYTEDDFDIYEKLTDQSSEIECLFVERTKQLLKDGGIAAIILPGSILNNTGIYTKAREIILLYFEIIGIAEFGSNTFMATGTNTVTMFLRRRNNYDHSNILALIKQVLNDHKDVTINGIEKPLNAYVKYVWEGLSYKDYLTLLQKQPNDSVLSHDIFKEYKSKIKAKTEDLFWSSVLELEQEKIFYFILALPQKIVLIKSGEKSDEKSFLGYEFSFARNNEGIHPIRRGKKEDGTDLTIDDCTKLFDSLNFDNPEKASTYMYRAFLGDYSSQIDPKIANHISRLNLVDLMLFDRSEFSKSVSLVEKKKVISKWPLEKLGVVCDLKIGATPSRDNYAFYENGIHPWVSISEMDGQIISNTKEKLSDLGVSKSSVKLIKKGTTLLSFKLSIGKVATAGTDLYTNEAIAGLEIKPEYSEKILNEYLFILFRQKFIDLEKGGYNAFGKSLNSTFLNEDVKVPQPPKSEQEKIISETSSLNLVEDAINKQIEGYRRKLEKMSEGYFLKTNLLTKIGTFAPNPQYGISKDMNTHGEGFKIFRMNEIIRGKMVDNGSMKRVSILPEDFTKFRLNKGDILFNRTNSKELVGKTGIFNLEGDYCFASYLIRLKIDTTQANASFVNLMMNSPIFQSNARASAIKAVKQANINAKKLSNFLIPLPSPTEQNEVAQEIERVETEIFKLEKELADNFSKKNLVLEKYL